MKNVRVREAAEYLGLSKSTLDKLRMGTEGPRFFKLGRAVIYNTSELDSWLTAHGRTSTWQAGNDNEEAAARAA